MLDGIESFRAPAFRAFFPADSTPQQLSGIWFHVAETQSGQSRFFCESLFTENCTTDDDYTSTFEKPSLTQLTITHHHGCLEDRFLLQQSRSSRDDQVLVESQVDEVSVRCETETETETERESVMCMIIKSFK